MLDIFKSKVTRDYIKDVVLQELHSMDREHFAPNSNVEEYSLVTDLSMDSLEIVDLQERLEKKLDKTFSVYFFWELKNPTVGDVIDTIYAEYK